MNVANALVNPVFWIYTTVVALVLAASWGVLLWRGPRDPRGNEWRRLLGSWILYAAISSVAILLGREVFALVVALIALFACKEFARATGLYEDWLFTALVYLLILVVNVVALWPGYDIFMASPIYAVGLLCLLPVLRDQAEGMLQRVALSVMAFVYFGFFLAHLSLLGSTPDPERVYAYLFFLLYGTATADFTGWLAGRYLGKHPLAAHISPDWTVERAAATLAWAALWSFGVGWWLPSPFPWQAMLLATVLFGILGPLGELVMHYILRDLGLKPSATNYVPLFALGHVHRLIFVAPLFFRLVHWFEPKLLQLVSPS
jgi:phosphatidate cytidylyltransferase